MNFDEASEHEDAAEEDRPRSLSPNTDGRRPASASSGKDAPVSGLLTAEHQILTMAAQCTNSLSRLSPGAGVRRLTHRRGFTE